MTRQEKLIGGFAIALIVLGLAAYTLIPSLLSGIDSANRNLVGIVINGTGELKMRLGDTANWRTLKEKDPIYSKAYLFTGNQSTAEYLFLDESTITLNENSLVFIDFNGLKASKTDDSLDIDLIDGKMVLDLSEKNNFKKIKVAETTIDVTEQKTKIVIGSDEKLGVDISVYQGGVDISRKDQKINLKSGEKISVSQNEIVKEAVDSELLDELNRLAESDRKRILSELRKDRELTVVFKKVLESMRQFLR